MAYLLNDPNNQDPQNPQQGSQNYANQSGVVGGAPGKGQSVGGDQQQAPTHSGTDFVNLQSFLGANSSQDRTNAINNAANGIFSNEQSTYDKAAQPLRDANFSPMGSLDKFQVDDFVNRAAKGDQGAMTYLKNASNQSYTGPTSVNYQFGEGDQRDIKNLESPGTIADTLAKDSIAKGTYGMGLHNLDNAIYTGDPNVSAAGQQIGKKYDDFQKTTNQEMTNLNNKAAGFASAANSAATGVRGQLTDYQNELIGNETNRANAANANDVDKEKQALSDYFNWYYNTGLNLNNQGNGNWLTGVYGNTYNAPSRQATPSDMVSPDDAAKFSTLSSLLGGDPAMTQGSGYTPFSSTPVSGQQGQIDYREIQNPQELAKKFGINAFGAEDGMAYNPQRSDYQYLTPLMRQWFDDHPGEGDYRDDPSWNKSHPDAQTKIRNPALRGKMK